MIDKDISVTYLSDDELEKLIADTENETLVQAPEYIDKRVISVIKSREQRKVIDFWQYCARVAVAVAVALIFVYTVPFVPNLNEAISSPSYSKEDVLSAKPVKTKKEVLEEMNDPGFIEKTEMSIRSQIDELIN